MALQESGEMYLEYIYMLLKEKSDVHAVDVSEYLGYSKPSVSRAMGILKNGGYIIVDEDGHIQLTNEGRKVAEVMYERHTLLTNFLMSIGVDEKTAADFAAVLICSYPSISPKIGSLSRSQQSSAVTETAYAPRATPGTGISILCGTDSGVG